MAAPPSQYTPPPQPYAPPPQTYAPPQAGYAPLFQPSTAPYPALVKNSMLVIMVVVSLLTIFLGAMMVHSAPMTYNKEYSSDQSGQDQRADDQRTAVTVTNVGHILADVGAFLLIMFLLLAGMLRSDWSDYVRFGILFFVAVFAFSLGFRV
jgi:hypothetical protein